jgi:uncharacterized heparinase superfamily protein
MAGPTWVRDARLRFARLPRLRESIGMGRVPDAPALPVRDPWPGEPSRGGRLLKGEMELAGSVCLLQPGNWANGAPLVLRANAHGFTWLRDLRALGTDSARVRARALVADWIAAGSADPLSQRPDITGARIAAWLGHYDFFAASAEDSFRQKLMTRLVADARALAAQLPAEQMDARALTALKGLVAAAVALPDHAAYLTRALRLLPQEIARQALADGCQVERSPAAQLSALQDLTEIRAMLQAAQVQPPAALPVAIERMALALRVLRHGDSCLALFNGAKEEPSSLVDQVLNQAGRAGRPPVGLNEGGFQRLQAGRSTLIIDCGVPPGPGLDRYAHAGTLAFELSVGRERMIVNCGGAPAAGPEWQAATRATAAHSTLVVGDINSSELRAEGLGRRPEKVDVQRQEANGAHWLEASHDGYAGPFGTVHRRRLYMAESGEDIRGEDAVESDTPQSFTVHFHLHPNVQAAMLTEGDGVLLRLPNSGGWRLRAEGAAVSLEESIYLGGIEPRRSEQVVLTGTLDGPQQVKWAITKVG